MSATRGAKRKATVRRRGNADDSPSATPPNARLLASLPDDLMRSLLFGMPMDSLGAFSRVDAEMKRIITEKLRLPQIALLADAYAGSAANAVLMTHRALVRSHNLANFDMRLLNKSIDECAAATTAAAALDSHNVYAGSVLSYVAAEDSIYHGSAASAKSTYDRLMTLNTVDVHDDAYPMRLLRGFSPVARVRTPQGRFSPTYYGVSGTPASAFDESRPYVMFWQVIAEDAVAPLEAYADPGSGSGSGGESDGDRRYAAAWLPSLERERKQDADRASRLADMDIDVMRVVDMRTPRYVEPELVSVDRVPYVDTNQPADGDKEAQRRAKKQLKAYNEFMHGSDADADQVQITGRAAFLRVQWANWKRETALYLPRRVEPSVMKAYIAEYAKLAEVTRVRFAQLFVEQLVDTDYTYVEDWNIVNGAADLHASYDDEKRAYDEAADRSRYAGLDKETFRAASYDANKRSWFINDPAVLADGLYGANEATYVVDGEYEGEKARVSQKVGFHPDVPDDEPFERGLSDALETMRGEIAAAAAAKMGAAASSTVRRRAELYAKRKLTRDRLLPERVLNNGDQMRARLCVVYVDDLRRKASSSSTPHASRKSVTLDDSYVLHMPPNADRAPSAAEMQDKRTPADTNILDVMFEAVADEASVIKGVQRVRFERGELKLPTDTYTAKLRDVHVLNEWRFGASLADNGRTQRSDTASLLELAAETCSPSGNALLFHPVRYPEQLDTGIRGVDGQTLSALPGYSVLDPRAKRSSTAFRSSELAHSNVARYAYGAAGKPEVPPQLEPHADSMAFMRVAWSSWSHDDPSVKHRFMHARPVSITVPRGALTTLLRTHYDMSVHYARRKALSGEISSGAGAGAVRDDSTDRRMPSVMLDFLAMRERSLASPLDYTPELRTTKFNAWLYENNVRDQGDGGVLREALYHHEVVEKVAAANNRAGEYKGLVAWLLQQQQHMASRHDGAKRLAAFKERQREKDAAAAAAKKEGSAGTDDDAMVIKSNLSLEAHDGYNNNNNTGASTIANDVSCSAASPWCQRCDCNCTCDVKTRKCTCDCGCDCEYGIAEPPSRHHSNDSISGTCAMVLAMSDHEAAAAIGASVHAGGGGVGEGSTTIGLRVAKHGGRSDAERTYLSEPRTRWTGQARVPVQVWNYETNAPVCEHKLDILRAIEHAAKTVHGASNGERQTAAISDAKQYCYACASQTPAKQQ